MKYDLSFELFHRFICDITPAWIFFLMHFIYTTFKDSFTNKKCYTSLTAKGSSLLFECQSQGGAFWDPKHNLRDFNLWFWFRDFSMTLLYLTNVCI